MLSDGSLIGTQFWACGVLQKWLVGDGYRELTFAEEVGSAYPRPAPKSSLRHPISAVSTAHRVAAAGARRDPASAEDLHRDERVDLAQLRGGLRVWRALLGL